MDIKIEESTKNNMNLSWLFKSEKRENSSETVYRYTHSLPNPKKIARYKSRLIKTFKKAGWYEGRQVELPQPGHWVELSESRGWVRWRNKDGILKGIETFAPVF